MKRLVPFLALLILSISSNCQSLCDSLLIHEVSFDPLNSETKVQVIVENTSSTFFSYPKFVLRNALNDTVASEDINFFGIGNYKQTHTLNIHSSLVNNTLAGGKLQLYSVNDTLACEWINDYDLCVDSCIDLVVIMQGTEFPSAYHRYEYVISDSSTTVVWTDTLVVDSADYTDRDSICLPKGTYSITFTEEFSSANEDVHVRVDPYYNTTGPLAKGQDELSFDLNVFTACLDTVAAGFDKYLPSEISAFVSDQYLLLNGLKAEGQHVISLYSMSGQSVYNETIDQKNASIHVDQLSQGIYILHVQNEEAIHSKKVFISGN